MLDQHVKAIYGGKGCEHYSQEQIAENCTPSTITFRNELKLPKKFEAPCAIGIEVELEKLNENGVDGAFWKGVADHSLKVQGLEFVSYPLKNSNIPLALGALQYVFMKNPKCEFSHRCSIHVHLDASNLKYESLLVLTGFYLSIEKVLFKNLFPDRLGNAYCFPLSDVQLKREDIKAGNLSKETFKYAALNMYHLKDYGTLEFRHHPGTKDMNALLHWINILSSIYCYGKEHSLKEFKQTLLDLNTTSLYYEYVRKAFPFWNANVTRAEMYDAVTAAKLFINS